MRDHLELRAQDPVARCLIRRLVVPRVYFDADWPGLADSTVDVLAIDRDGIGDTHLVQVRQKAADALALIPTLFRARAPFRWIAFLRGTEDAAITSSLASQKILFPPDAAGRIGVIEIIEMAEGELGANVRIKPERFHTPVYDLAAKFVGTHQAQIQFGD